MEDAVDCSHRSFCFCSEHNQTTIRTVWTRPDVIAISCWLAFQRFPADMRLLCISFLRPTWSGSGERLTMALSQPVIIASSLISTVSQLFPFSSSPISPCYFFSTPSPFLLFFKHSWQANGSHEVWQRSGSRKRLFASHSARTEERDESEKEGIRCPIYSFVFVFSKSGLMLRKTTPG